jgi:leucyl-tRNA synthetase
MAAPFAPHICEELWQKLGHIDSLTYESFPTYDEKYLVEDNVECVVQIQGKVRAKLQVSPNITDEELEKAALSDERVISLIGAQSVRKIITRPPKVISIVLE